MATRPPRSIEATRRRHAERLAQRDMQTAEASRPRSPSQARSQASDDWQTVMDEQEYLSHSQKAQEDGEALSEESLHCWICLVDEARADSEAGEWKSPCSCNLTAHEDCLLQWIASQKGPIEKVFCPQCKTEIKIAQPHDYLVNFLTTIQNVAEDSILPFAMVAALGITYSGLLVYGANTVKLIFGAQEAEKILASPAIRQASNKGNLLWNGCKDFVVLTCPFFPTSIGLANWSNFISLPMIAPMLVMSRFPIADTFTVVPLGLTRSSWQRFLGQIFINCFTDFTVHYLIEQEKPSLKWPPSPGLTLALLPTFRTLYSNTYNYFFRDLEQSWDQAIQRKPRDSETAEEVAAQEAADRDNERHILEIGLEIGPAEVQHQEAPRNANIDQNAQLQEAGLLQQVELEGGPEVQVDALRARQNAAVRNANGLDHQVDVLERRLNITGGDGLATTVLGALFLPAISWAMGNFLKATLPKTWVKAPHVAEGYRSSGKLSWSEGFLQSQFGRSVAGGCLFIVLKDALMLYYKWKRAKDFGKRRILNYNEAKRNGRTDKE